MLFRYVAARGQTQGTSIGVLGAVLLFTALLSGCATRSFVAGDPAGEAFMERAITREKGPVRVTAAVPDAAETETLTGLSLYEQGIQPVWLEITNNGTSRLRLALSSIDRDYYSPFEVAWMNRGGHTKEARTAMERWFHEHAIERWIPPGETRSGLVFTQVMPGTKGFNVDLFSSPEISAHSFTFFVPMPGFVADYMQVDFAGLYEPHERETLSAEELRRRIIELPCCGTDETGTLIGDAFNVVLVATPLALRRALLRGGWQETAGGAIETTVARKQRFHGRRPDGTFMKTRPDGSERKEVRLWLTPVQSDGEPVWAVQVLYNFGGGQEVTDSERLDPDIDQARNYFLQDLGYSQSVSRATFTRAFDPVPESSPVTTFTGSHFHTDGLSVVVWLSEETVALDDIELMGWWWEDKKNR